MVMRVGNMDLYKYYGSSIGDSANQAVISQGHVCAQERQARCCVVELPVSKSIHHYQHRVLVALRRWKTLDTYNNERKIGG